VPAVLPRAELTVGLGGTYTATGRCVLAIVLSASPLASANIVLVAAEEAPKKKRRDHRAVGLRSGGDVVFR
jgi:hypothetical protein